MNLTRLKLAAALMALECRYDAVTQEDWERAGAVLAVSNATRHSIQELHRSEASRQNVHRGKMDGVRAAVAEDIRHSRAVSRVAENIVTKLKDSDGSMPRAKLYKKFNSRDRPYFDEAEQLLWDHKRIEKCSSTNDGPEGIIVRLTEGS